LREYKVDIIPEYELYKEPMRIDVVVIKLLEDVVIDNTLMRFFRRHNIVEFKGPTDTLNIKAFDRVLAYFYAYLSQNSVVFSEAAITFVSVRRPEKLFRVLQKERGYKIIASEARGIYYIVGEGQSSTFVPAMQLAVSSELSAEDLEWVGAIRNDLTAEYGVKLVEKPEVVGEDAPLREFMYLLYHANYNILEEVENMTVAEKKVRKYLDGWAVRSGAAERWKQEAWQEGKQEGRQEGRYELLEFLRNGHSLEEAEKAFALR
ncbi:MAG: hypothetical protein LBC70_02255, partial [Chitinispirillales bacterium]|nr:hypothetical protein [Chitinispirillales bacterium]